MGNPKPTIFCDLDSASRLRWERVTQRVIKGWQLAMQEPWLDNDLSRVVVFQSTFLVSFNFATGDAKSREKAWQAAIDWARASSLKTAIVGSYKCFAIPGAVAFTSPFGSAGWALEDAADRLVAIVERAQPSELERVLQGLGAFAPRDHSLDILERVAGPCAREPVDSTDGNSQASRHIAPELAAAGVTVRAVELLLRFKDAERACGCDPYLASRGSKAAATRLRNLLLDELGGPDVGRLAWAKVNSAYDMHGTDGLYVSAGQETGSGVCVSQCSDATRRTRDGQGAP